MKLAAVLVVIAMLGAAELRAQSVSPSEREALDRIATEAAAKGLPSAPLANKIQEGIAKGYPAARIEPVIRQLAAQLDQQTIAATSAPDDDKPRKRLFSFLGSGGK